MAKHKHGQMDIAEQEKMFAGFVRFATWGVVIIFAALVLLALVNS